MDPDCNSEGLGQSDDKKNCLIFIATKARTKGENSIQGVGGGGGKEVLKDAQGIF